MNRNQQLTVNKQPFTFHFSLLAVSLVLMLLLPALAACSREAAIDQPPVIRYGEDICDHCQMIISEARFAASYVTEAREVRRFDDIGNMMLHLAEKKEAVAVFWVHDYESEEWLPAEEAHFVVSSAIHTPMGHGVVALASAERAASLAEEWDGRVFQFNELVAYYTGENRPAHDHSHHH
jgi:copper chaperone NosL